MSVLPTGRYLPEADGHHVWWCEAGLPAGLPVLVLHGGPGGRTRVPPFRWFDGLAVRCIAYDQRGCGSSTPAGRREHNTLAHLVADAERLRVELGLPAWGVVGGSWGALVALAYAAAHPQRVRGLMLRSAFLGSDDEVARYFAPWPAWLGDAGAAWLGLEAARAVPPFALLASGAPGHARPGRVAAAWSAFDAAQMRPGGVAEREGAAATFVPPAAWTAADDEQVPHGVALQVRYLAAHCDVAPGEVEGWLQALRAAWSAAARPVTLVHGARDAVCRPDISEHIAALGPPAELHRVEGGGHDMDAPPMRDALTAAAHAWVAKLERA